MSALKPRAAGLYNVGREAPVVPGYLANALWASNCLLG